MPNARFTVEDERPATTLEPMEAAKARVRAERAKNELEAALKVVKERLNDLGAYTLKVIVEDEALPESSRVDGATVFIRTDVRASAKDHAEVTLTLEELIEQAEADGDTLRADEYRQLLPSNVNASKLAGWVREHLPPPDPNHPMTLEERLLHPEPKPFPRKLLPLVKLTEQTSVVVNGA